VAQAAYLAIVARMTSPSRFRSRLTNVGSLLLFACTLLTLTACDSRGRGRRGIAFDGGAESDAGAGFDLGEGFDAGEGVDLGSGFDAGGGFDAGRDAGGGFDAGRDAGRDSGGGGTLREGDLRLAEGSSGLLEVYAMGAWGTVCDDLFDDVDATVACQQLGFSSGVLAVPAVFGTGDIWMDDVQCTGSESRLIDCPFGGLGMHNCSHSEDVALICTP
jgi:hypothetical protein